MYVITGASGNTGGVVAENLLAHGKEVRVLGRNADHLKDLENKGAEIVTLDVNDTKKLTDAFRGAEGVYLMIPPYMGAENWMVYMDEITDNYVEAIKEAKVPYAVFLSSIGAQHSEGTGPIKAVHRGEKKLEKLDGINVLALRPGFFMENFFWAIDGVKEHGVFGSLAAPDVKMPIIATKDIGEYAAKRLAAKDFNGFSTKELHGERDLRMDEAAKILGAAVGKPDLPYQQFPEDMMRDPMKAMGATDNAIDEYFEMNRGFNSGHVHALEERNLENTTPTSIEEFAKVFAHVYNNA